MRSLRSPRSTAGSCISSTISSSLRSALRSEKLTRVPVRGGQAPRLSRPGAGKTLGQKLPYHRKRGLQDGRYLRRRVLRRNAVFLFHVRRVHPRRGVAVHQREQKEPHHRHRFRPHPHRAGHRVRLFLRALRVDAQRAGVRSDHHQQQPRDRLHRLRYGGQAVLRAAHPRGRAERHRQGKAVRRRHHLRRPDGDQAVQLSRQEGRAHPRHLGRQRRHGGGPRALRRTSGTASASAARRG